jgi:hypothetical protein
MLMPGWLKRLFGSEKEKTVSDVLTAYGDLLNEYPISIGDVSMLPISKTQMKALLKTLYGKASDTEQERLLHNGFMFLANFQDGVGATPIYGGPLDSDMKYETKATLAQLDEWLPWQKLVVADMEILGQEWKRFLDGEPI